MGDEAPFCAWRDELLGLSSLSFSRWLAAQPDVASAATIVATRFRAIRRTILPTRAARNLSLQDGIDVVKRAAVLEGRAAGRSIVDEDFKSRKRIAYAVRLARGE